VNGTLGRGSGRISVSTLSGRVTLLKRAEQPPGPRRSESTADSPAEPTDPTTSGDPWSAATDDAPTKGEAR
jgi:hypothetical protein